RGAAGPGRPGAPGGSLVAAGGRGARRRPGGRRGAARPAVLASCDPRQTLTRLLPPGMLSDRMAARAAHIPTENLGAAYLKVDVATSGRLALGRHQAWRGDGLDLRVPGVFVGSLEDMVSAYEHA